MPDLSPTGIWQRMQTALRDWWDAAQHTWVGYDHRVDFSPTKPPDYTPDWSQDPTGMDALDGKSPFIVIADGKSSLFVPSGIKDGPLPTHYEPALFGASAVSTATAPLSLATQHTATPDSAARLERLALIASSTELALAIATDRHWQRQGMATPLRQQPTVMAYRFGFHGLGVLVPVLIHSISLLRRRRSRRLSMGAAMATLAGGYIFRSVLVSAGRAAAQRPADYFRFTQPSRDDRPKPALPSLVALGQKAVEILEQALHLAPPRLGKEMDEVEQVVSRLRDILIQYLRQDQTSSAVPRWQAALASVNAALSLIVGVEYPAAGPQRSSIEQARDTLARMLAEGLLVEPGVS